MTPDAALDSFAFSVALRLMGADARRQLRMALLDDATADIHSDGILARLGRLDALLGGRQSPECLQDRLDLARAEADRDRPPFDAAFWLAREAALVAAGFAPQQAAQLVEKVRGLLESAPAEETTELMEVPA